MQQELSSRSKDSQIERVSQLEGDAQLEQRPQPVDALGDALDLLVLRSLSWGPRHGYGVAEWIGAATGDDLRIVEGSIYPVLHVMEKRGWVSSSWQTTSARRAKFYTLTERGRGRLGSESERWLRYSRAMTRALDASETVIA